MYKNPWMIGSRASIMKLQKERAQQVGEDLVTIQDRIIELGYDLRPTQNDIMWDIIDALEEQRNYLIEAGVGIGKSFAYLIPGVLLSKYTGEPLVVASSTIHLLEQLERDIPNLENILNPCIGTDGIEVVVAKGRTHYPCTHKIESIINTHISNKDYVKVEIYEEILEKAKEGADRQNKMGIDEKFWGEITNHTCDRDHKYRTTDCPLYRMRENIKVSQTKSPVVYSGTIRPYRPKVIITTQDFLISHFQKLRNTGHGLLPDSTSMLIIDEVHNLEDKARSALTNELDENFIKDGLRSTKNLYGRLNGSNRWDEIDELENAIRAFFKEIKNNLFSEADDLKYDGEYDNLFIKPPSNNFKNLSDDIEGFISNIEIDLTYQFNISQNLENESETVTENLRTISEFIESCYDNPGNNIIWGKVSKRSRKFKVVYCPDKVSETLNTELFSKNYPTIGLTATMTVLDDNGNPSYDYIKESIGFNGGTKAPKQSPFPYENSRLFIPDDLPNSSERDEYYFEAIADHIRRITESTNGGALVLFTSKHDLNEVHKKLKVVSKVPVYKGMKSEQTKSILQKHEENRGIILGTGTFWEGLDLKGKKLTNLITVRLPYPVPSPILKRKQEQLSFKEVIEPEMVTKLRQGTGRLIRSKDDVGVCTILDSRLNTDIEKRRLVINSLPFKNIITDYKSLKQYQEENRI